MKNKVCFLVDYQGQRFDHPPGGQFISVFTPAEQGGNFAALCKGGCDGSGVCLDRLPGPTSPANTVCANGSNANGCLVANQLYNPCAAGTGINGVACSAATTRAPFANNQIPLGMISPVASALFASPLYPTTVNNNLTNNALQERSTAYNSDQGDIKVDYRVSSKDLISGRFTRAFQIDPSTNSQLLLANGEATAPIWSVVGDWTRSISNNLVNDARFGWNHVILNTGSTWDSKVAKFGEAIGIPNSNPGSLIGLLGLDFGGGTPTSPGNGTLT